MKRGGKGNGPMRNKYPGTCYQCGEPVQKGEGHYQRFRANWLLHHAGCAIYFRNKPEQHVSELTGPQRKVWRKTRQQHDRKGLPADANPQDAPIQ